MEPQFLIGWVHFLLIFSTDKNKAFSNEDFVGKTLLFLFILLNCAFKLSMAFVVYITLLVSGENLKIGVIQSQFVYHDFRELGYFLDHFSLTASKLYLACSSHPDK